MSRRGTSFIIAALLVLPLRGNVRALQVSNSPCCEITRLALGTAKDPQQLFQQGEAALQSGNLDAADRFLS